MNPRIAVVLLLAFVAVLLFVGWAIETRRARSRASLSRQRDRIGQYQALVDEVHSIARQSLAIDPSAALIDMTISSFKQKELP